MEMLPANERHLLQHHCGSSNGISSASDSRCRCPALPGLTDSALIMKWYEVQIQSDMRDGWCLAENSVSAREAVGRAAIALGSGDKIANLW